MGRVGLHSLVGCAQRLTFVFDGRGHVPGQNFAGVVVQSGDGYGFRAHIRAKDSLRDKAQRVRQNGGVRSVLAEGFRARGAHQAPPGDVFHAREQRIKGIQLHCNFFLAFLVLSG